MRILVTSGGTKIPIDMVRNITNMSKGTFGSKIATELLEMGHEVYFFKAQYSISPFDLNLNLCRGDKRQIQKLIDEKMAFTERHQNRYLELEYSTFEDYQRWLRNLIKIDQFDTVVLAAAVSDYGVENPVDGKVRSDGELQIKLKRLPKLINQIKEWNPSCKLVGFKLLVKSMEWQLIEAAKKSIVENKCDMVVANDLQDIKEGKHKVHLVFPDQETHTYYTDPSDPNALARKVAEFVVKL